MTRGERPLIPQRFAIHRDGAYLCGVEAVGMLSALVKFGQENPDVDPNAEWVIERVADQETQGGN